MAIIHQKEFLTKEECDWIISLHKLVNPIEALIAGKVDRAIRNSDVYWIPSDGEIKLILNRIHEKFSLDYWGYGDLAPPKRIQLTHYKQGGHYKWHRDIGRASPNRRVSVVLTLSEDYQGCELEFHDRAKLEQSLGMITLFDSDTLHRVTPLISGERWSLVYWLEI